MSISILQSPDQISMGFMPMNFVASSTVNNNSNFRFYTEIRNADDTLIKAFRNIPQPSNRLLLFDAHRIIENYLSYDITNLIEQNTGVKAGENVVKKYKLFIQEEWADASGVFSGYASTTTAAVYAINASPDWLAYLNLSVEDRVLPNINHSFLTNQPSTIKIRPDDSYEIGFLVDLSSVVEQITVDQYNAAGTLINTGIILNVIAPVTDEKQNFVSLLVGPADLLATTFDGGSFSMSNLAYYTVYCENNSGIDQVSKKLTFEIDRSCTRDGYVRLFWLNPWGRFDAYNFTGVADDNIDVEKSNYNKLLGSFDGATFGYTTYEQQKRQFFTKSTQKYKLRSGDLDTDTAFWLKELIQSPLVYILKENPQGVNEFVGVNIDTTSYQAKKNIVDKKIFIEFDAMLSVQNMRQRL